MANHRSVVHLDKGWTFRQGDEPLSSNPWRSTAMSPTNIHLDLLSHSLISDPFIGMNEEQVQWIGDHPWIYQLSFNIPEDLFKNPRNEVVLVFEGLDTFATVKLNGETILSSDNMFVCHRVPIQEKILVRNARKYDEQVLQVYFDSATRRGQEELEKNPSHHWGVFSGDPSRTAVRKAQYHYGWDWGPRLVTTGPWKPIYLEVYEFRISDVSIQTKISQNLKHAEVTVTLDIEGSTSYATLSLSKDGTSVSQCTVPVQHGTAATTFLLKDPSLWWPFTLGGQPLYTLTAILSAESDQNIVVDTVTKKFGIRKIELIQRPLKDQQGSSFFFQINNVPLFAAGSCWIPADSFTPRITPEQYREWVMLVRKGNQVMLRVWGGGIYEHDALYDTCDELGILVWQDFMFACGNYPTYPSILQSIEVEAEQNIRRIRHHPCLAIWAGNNEDYLYHLIAGKPYDAEERDPQEWLTSAFPARYIYEVLLPKLCKRLTPDVPYRPGSPFGGTFANDPTVGDIHQWSVWHLEKRPYQDFASLSGRFVSEFGMQALPAAKTVGKYFHLHHSPTDGDRTQKRVNSEIMAWHNKATNAHEILAKYLDENINYTADVLSEYIYATQLLQSEALTTAYRSWRREWRGPGQEYCAGALVWQLNDCWPTTSWAVVDYWRRPKMGYWAIKRENQALTAGLRRIEVTGEGSGGVGAPNGKVRMEAWATNFSLREMVLDVAVRVWDVMTGEKVWEKWLHRSAILKQNRSTELGHFDVPLVGRDGRRIVVAIYLTSPVLSASDIPKVQARHVNFHEPLKEVPLQPEPRVLEVKICSQSSNSRRDMRGSPKLSNTSDVSPSDSDVSRKSWVELTAAVPMKGVLVETIDGGDVEWDDNGVDLLPGETFRLGARGLEAGDLRRLKVMWLGGRREGGSLVQGTKTLNRL